MAVGTRAISCTHYFLEINKCTLPFHLVFQNLRGCLIPLTNLWINNGSLLEGKRKEIKDQ